MVKFNKSALEIILALSSNVKNQIPYNSVILYLCLFQRMNSAYALDQKKKKKPMNKLFLNTKNILTKIFINKSIEKQIEK